MEFASVNMNILTHPEFLKRKETYKRAIHRLFYYGLVGKSTALPRFSDRNNRAGR